MKRILILGASNDQLPLILKSKELGYHVIVCDRTTTNPGLVHADKHYRIDYTDRDAVLDIAGKESIDGVISNSESAMLNVAYIAEELSLRGNPPESIRWTGEKNLFRKLQAKAGAYTPRQADVHSAEDAVREIGRMTLPVLVKPCRNSASRGIVKIDNRDEAVIRKAFETSSENSWNNEVSIEEFVEMPSLTIIEGDIFVYDDRILWSGLFNNIRSSSAPMVPMTDISPLALPEEKYKEMQKTVTAIVKEAGIRFGAFNIEMYFTKDGRLFVIEINTRQGGVGVPGFIERYSGIDFSKLLVSLSVNDYSYCDVLDRCRYPVFRNLTRHVVFARQDGIYDGLYISEELGRHVVNVESCTDKGDRVTNCGNGTDAIARVDLLFDTYEQQIGYVYDIENYIYPIIHQN